MQKLIRLWAVTDSKISCTSLRRGSVIENSLMIGIWLHVGLPRGCSCEHVAKVHAKHNTKRRRASRQDSTATDSGRQAVGEREGGWGVTRSLTRP